MPHIWFQSSWLLDVFPNVAEGLHGVRGVGGAKTLRSCVNVMLAFSTRGYLSRASSQKRFFFSPCALLSDMHSCSKNNCRRARGFTCTWLNMHPTWACLSHNRCSGPLCVFIYIYGDENVCMFVYTYSQQSVLWEGRGLHAYLTIKGLWPSKRLYFIRSLTLSSLNIFAAVFWIFIFPVCYCNRPTHRKCLNPPLPKMVLLDCCASSPPETLRSLQPGIWYLNLLRTFGSVVSQV